ncbi:MAG: hypothetical protein U1B80_07585, partial [Anaerolineaceae bacterium]|nr:hypothetical protein [Anaerolineaceae bacterium]
PTLTPTQLPRRVALIAPPGSEPNQAQAVADALAEMSAAAGLTFETLASLAPSDIPAGLKAVVYLAPTADLLDVVRAAPQVQFVVVSPHELEPASNLSVIRSQPEHVSFIAGATAVVIAFDWRAAGLLSADAIPGGRHEELFRNGGRYYCGICNPYYAPHVRFPLTAALPSGSDPSSWRLKVDELLFNIVYVVYVAPEAASPELLGYLAAKKLILIGAQTPPEEVRSRWAATIASDILTPLKELLPAVLAGEGGKAVFAPVTFRDVQPAFLSPGRQALIEKIIADLADGWIHPYSVPAQ